MILTLEQYHGLLNATSRSVGEPTNKGFELWDLHVEEFEHIWGKCAGVSKCIGVPFAIFTDKKAKKYNFTKKQLEKIKKYSFTEKQWEKIRLAMDEIEDNTCIR